MGPVIICDDLQRHNMSRPDPPLKSVREAADGIRHMDVSLYGGIKLALTSRFNFHTSVTLTSIDWWAGLWLKRAGFWIKHNQSDGAHLIFWGGSTFFQKTIDGWTVTGFPPHASVNSSITSSLCAHQKAPTDFCRLALISFTAPNLTLRSNLTDTLITHSSWRYVCTHSDVGLC